MTDARPAASTLIRPAIWLIVVVLHLAAGWTLSGGGPISVDEVAYDWQVQALAAGHLAIDNGDPVLASAQVQGASTIMQSHGVLHSKYPVFGAVLPAALYGLLGVRAHMLVNGLALVFAGLCTWRLGRRAGLAPIDADIAVALLAVGTYTWQYGVGIWPHAQALALTTAALLAAWGARPSEGGRGWRQGLSGLLLGLAIGVRLDAAILAPAIAFPLAEPGRRGLAATVRWGAGLALPLLGMAVVNLFKFKQLWPFLYHDPVSVDEVLRGYLPAALLGAVVLALRLVPAANTRVVAVLSDRRVWLGGGLALLLGMIFVPQVYRAVACTWILLGDLRELGPANVPPGAIRLDSGEVVYFGAIKKALLQSCPWAVAAGAALLARGPTPQARGRRLELALGPALLLLVFGSVAWHGGMGLNLRYFLPALPMLAILAADAVARLRSADDRVALAAVGLGGMTAMLIWSALGASWPVSPDRAALPLSVMPLVLAALLCIGLLLHHRIGPRVALFAFGLAVTWSAATAFTYDLPATLQRRAATRDAARAAAAFVPPGAVVVCTAVEPCAPLKGLRDAVVVDPAVGGWVELPAVLAWAREQGRPVIGWMHPVRWQQAADAGVLEGVGVEWLGEAPGGRVGRLVDDG